MQRPQWAVWLHEGVLIALVALALYVLMALSTYHSSDPGFTHASGAFEVHNITGRAGAWTADFLFFLLGYCAWSIPFLFMLKALQTFRLRHQPWQWRPWLWVLRFSALLLLMLSIAALLDMHCYPNPNMPGTAGGMAGQTVAKWTIAMLAVQGSSLLLTALFLFGLTLFADLSWLLLLDLVGKITLEVFAWISALLRHLRAIQAQRQAEPRVIEQEPSPLKAKASGDELVADKPELPILSRAREERLEPSISLDFEALPVPPPMVAPLDKPAPKPRVNKPRTPIVAAVDEPAYGLPPLSLLDRAQKKQRSLSPAMLESMSRLLETKLKEFGVEVTVESVHPGPVITRFEIQPAAGVKVSRIANLAKDLARSLAVISVRVVEVIPGKTTVGIEIPNEDRQIVRFSEVLETPEYESAQSPVTIALGHDIGGKPVIADLARMPHLLVAGTTGSGKSVGVNAMLLSILFKSTPEQARLIMIDPKMLELSIYEGIPHLLCPVVTDMKEAANALRWSVAEMERRYRLMSAMGVRNLAGFNRKVSDAEQAGAPIADPMYKRSGEEDEEIPVLKPLPTIVVVVDEFADMMMIVGKKVEELIARIAQKARAAGIHLILATQRPSVDVITGLIKANIPTRMAFQVSSKIDSRTILDQGGAEQLLGHGDMLYLPPGTGLPIRVHGAFVSDDEVHRTVEAWKQRGAPDYIEEIIAGVDDSAMLPAGSNTSSEGNEESDPLYDEAVRFVTETRRASISSVQRKFKIGYNRAASMIESMEMAGVVSSMNHTGSREVLAPPPVGG